MNNVEKILSNVLELQSMPTVFLEALDNIQDPKANAMKLANIVSKDMALTTKLLRLVNSSYYGISQKITQVNNAIALLGFRIVKDIIMVMALKPMMSSQSGKDLWEHSIRCAYASQILAESIIEIPAEEVFTIGLLHDIGRVLFQIYDLESFNEMVRLSNMGIEKLLVEEEIFGVDHTIVGEAFTIKEKLPYIISSTIRYHHDPLNENAPTMARIVYLAEMLIQPNPKNPIIEDEFMEQLGIEIEDLEELRQEIFDKTDIIINALK
ncbi:MAG: HDOD domain-containing protein [bacterium]